MSRSARSSSVFGGLGAPFVATSFGSSTESAGSPAVRLAVCSDSVQRGVGEELERERRRPARRPAPVALVDAVAHVERIRVRQGRGGEDVSEAANRE